MPGTPYDTSCCQHFRTTPFPQTFQPLALLPQQCLLSLVLCVASLRHHGFIAWLRYYCVAASFHRGSFALWLIFSLILSYLSCYRNEENKINIFFKGREYKHANSKMADEIRSLAAVSSKRRLLLFLFLFSRVARLTGVSRFRRFRWTRGSPNSLAIYLSPVLLPSIFSSVPKAHPKFSAELPSADSNKIPKREGGGYTRNCRF